MKNKTMAELATALFMAATYPTQAGPNFQFPPDGRIEQPSANSILNSDASKATTSQLSLVGMFGIKGQKRPLYGIFATPDGKVMQLDCKDLDTLHVMLILTPQNMSFKDSTPEKLSQIKQLTDDTQLAQTALQCPRIEV